MARKKAWTVMVYLAGDNNLTTECMFALTEIRKAALGKNLNVVAQFDPSDPYLPTHRYEFNKAGDRRLARFDIIDRAAFNHDTQEVCFSEESDDANAMAAARRSGREFRNAAYDEARLINSEDIDEVITDDTDTGSPIPLYNFISFCIRKYPADHYMVVLSGHAGGTERDYLMRDDSPNGSLTFKELKQVFGRVKQDLGKLIDIVGMDNCLMSMAEICYELKNSVEVVVGCESFSPASGWPYRQILERIRRNFIDGKPASKRADVEGIATAIVEEYVNYYSHYWIAGLSVTQSALKLSKADGLQHHVDRLARAMEQELVEEYERQANDRRRKTPFQDALLLAHWETQSYNGEQFVDLYDFCDCLESRIRPGLIASRCKELKEFIKSEFVLKSCYCGAEYQYSYGVSIYFPWSQMAPAYSNLDFVKDTARGWGSFLTTYTLLTRREPRGASGRTKLTAELNRMIDSRMSSVRMAIERMDSGRMGTERMGTERMGTERMGTERMGTERMGVGSYKNRIHSMRNPPNVFFPDKCIRERQNTLATLETLRLR